VSSVKYELGFYILLDDIAVKTSNLTCVKPVYEHVERTLCSILQFAFICRKAECLVTLKIPMHITVSVVQPVVVGSRNWD
jgi:hypothetical protein